MRRWILPILALPVMVMVVVPAAIVYCTRDTCWASAWVAPATVQFWVGIASALLGLVLSGWSVALFARVGEGTAAPWDPPRRFVVRGPYRHVRNPMISGVQALLIAEALLLCSWPLGIWCLLFGFGNAVYIPLVEEKTLAKRYGQDYAEYKKHVARWLPSPTPWGAARNGKTQPGA
jgi:protein-S-isoprenylcysteine O-methyltransferase Ste14